MFAVLYRWRLKPGTLAEFREAWRAMTHAIAARSGTGGSRLHRSGENEVAGYAIWPSREAWEEASKLPSADPAAAATMKRCIEESLGTIPLDVLDDLTRPLP